MPDRIPTALIAARRCGCPCDCNRWCFIGSGEGGRRFVLVDPSLEALVKEVTADCFSRSQFGVRGFYLPLTHKRTDQVFLGRGVAVFHSELSGLAHRQPVRRFDNKRKVVVRRYFLLWTKAL